jgi:formylglycine-generating enzyme required for sulfatase activity
MNLRRTYKKGTGWNRVKRGGSWNYYASFLRAAHRSYSSPSYQDYDIGARLSKPVGGKDEA